VAFPTMLLPPDFSTEGEGPGSALKVAALHIAPTATTWDRLLFASGSALEIAGPKSLDSNWVSKTAKFSRCILFCVKVPVLSCSDSS